MVEVSVLSPSYGYGRFIGDALESVQAQEGVGVEHIVQDAGSEDDTVDVLRGFEDRITWRSEPDRGQSDGLNKAIASATGQWVAWLNADEFYFPDALRTLVAAAEAADADLVYADAVFITEDGRLLRLFPQHGFDPRVLRHYGPYIPSCTTVFRRSVLGPRPWDADIRRVMDWELYLRLLSEGARFLHVQYPVAAYRIHGGQVTAEPLEHYAGDHGAVRARYALPPTHLKRYFLPAKGMHAFHKLIEGAYNRQVRARAMRGTDLRWFRAEVGRSGFDELLQRCYGMYPGQSRRYGYRRQR